LVIGWLSPVWITSKLPVNERDTRRLTSKLSNGALDAKADGIVIARGEVRVVRMEALHAARRPPDSTARSMGHIGRDVGVPLRGVPCVGGLDSAGQGRVVFDVALRVPYASLRLEPSNAPMG
jgi:hypothetical protein